VVKAVVIGLGKAMHKAITLRTSQMLIASEQLAMQQAAQRDYWKLLEITRDY